MATCFSCLLEVKYIHIGIITFVWERGLKEGKTKIVNSRYYLKSEFEGKKILILNIKCIKANKQKDKQKIDRVW